MSKNATFSDGLPPAAAQIPLAAVIDLESKSAHVKAGPLDQWRSSFLDAWLVNSACAGLY